MRIPLDRLTAGMVLASSVTDPLGRVLLGTGERLTLDYIARLSRFGVETVDVASAPDADPAPPSNGRKAPDGASTERGAGAAQAPAEAEREARDDARWVRAAGQEGTAAIREAARKVLARWRPRAPQGAARSAAER